MATRILDERDLLKLNGRYSNALVGKLSGSVVRADDVSPLEHNVNVKVQGKNYFNPIIFEESETMNGVTITRNGNKFVINGTATVGFSFEKGMSWKVPQHSILSMEYLSGSLTKILWFSLRDKDNIQLQSRINIDGDSASYPKSTGDLIRAWFWIEKDTVFDNLTFTIQLEEGEEATAHTPYVDPSTVKVTRCGKNIIQSEKIDNAQWKNAPSYDSHGVLWTVSDDRKITIQGETPGDNYSVFDIATSDRFTSWLVDGATYTVSLNKLGNSNVELVAEIFDKNDGTVVTYIRDGVTFTVDKEKYTYGTLRLQISPSNIVNDIVMPQIEVGYSGTGFEPYMATVHTASSEGTVEGVTSLAPTMTLFTDKEGVTVECEYVKDSNAVIEKLTNAVIALGGTV